MDFDTIFAFFKENPIAILVIYFFFKDKIDPFFSKIFGPKTPVPSPVPVPGPAPVPAPADPNERPLINAIIKDIVPLLIPVLISFLEDQKKEATK